MGGNGNCILCGFTGHEIKTCPNLELARTAIKCDLCNANGHVVENCPNLAAAQAAIKSKAAAVVPKPCSERETIRRLPEDGPVLYFTNGNRSVDRGAFEIRRSPKAKNQYLGVFGFIGTTTTIELWSGTPGIVSRSALTFRDSVEFRITFGTGMIARAGGPGNYQRIPDHRGPVIHVAETDSNGDVTDVYIDVNDTSATIDLGWITDFIADQ